MSDDKRGQEAATSSDLSRQAATTPNNSLDDLPLTMEEARSQGYTQVPNHVLVSSKISPGAKLAVFLR